MGPLKHTHRLGLPTSVSPTKTSRIESADKLLPTGIGDAKEDHCVWKSTMTARAQQKEQHQINDGRSKFFMTAQAQDSKTSAGVGKCVTVQRPIWWVEC